MPRTSKKTEKKLCLTRETLRILVAEDLARAGGGLMVTSGISFPKTNAWSTQTTDVVC